MNCSKAKNEASDMKERAKCVQLAAPSAPGEHSLFNMVAANEFDENKKKNGMDTRSEAKEEERSVKKKSARQRHSDIPSSQDNEETEPDHVLAGLQAPTSNCIEEEQQLMATGSISNDGKNAPATMLVEANLAPELMTAEEVNIQEEEDRINKKILYRRTLRSVMVFYEIAILLNVTSFFLLFWTPPPAPWEEFYTADVGLAPSAAGCLFLATILMFSPTWRCCSSIRVEDPDDKRLVRDAQIASSTSLLLSIGAVAIIFALPPDLQWLRCALMTWGFAGTIFAFLRVRLLRCSKESRQEMSKAFWVSFLVFFLALCGATVWRSATIWRCLNPIPPYCFVESPSYIGDGICDYFYDTEECGYDGGDCVRNEEYEYPDCQADNLYSIGDGSCDGGLYNTAACGFDGGDCDHMNAMQGRYPDCQVVVPNYIGDGYCDGGDYNTKACGYDGGDCRKENASNETYPGCHVEYPIAIGDGFCDGGLYMTVECAYDGDDCLEFVGKYPDCHVDQPNRIGDGICDGWVYMTMECAYDGGDCVAFMEKYPDCHVENPSRIGDGTCDGGRYVTSGCAYDGGDCLAFIDQYPGCIVESPLLIGDGVCHPEPYNTKACGYDGGDCDAMNRAKYPGCHVENPSRIGDGTCDGRLYGTSECGFDGGDCLEAGKPCRGHRECASESCNATTNVCDSGVVSEQYPDCRVPMPQWIGDGECDGGFYASEACGFDGGDCLQIGEACLQDDECASGFCNNSTKVCYLGILQDYPDCVVEYPGKIGDGTCNFGEYLTEACGYDGGDCLY